MAGTVLLGSGAGSPTFLAARAAAPNGAVVSSNAHHDTSGPLRQYRAASTGSTAHPAHRNGRGPDAPASHQSSRDTSSASATPRIPTTNVVVGGIGANGSAPPDSDGAAGTTQYVELANSQFEVFNKSGGVVLSPRNTNTLWSGFGGDCQTHNDGDGTILWDSMAQRWFIQQFSIDTSLNHYYDCIAISTSSDATGTWNRYSFAYANFPDYPKTGVWPDAYYASFNLFNSSGTQGLGALLCAFNRSAMLSGASATQQCFTATTSGEHTYLPATLDGATPPPVGEPEWFVGLASSGASALGYFMFHVDWATPANSSLTSESTIAVNAFTQACGGGTCIPQAGTRQRLDSLGDRVMYRLAYRNFGDHEAMVVNHSVTAGSSVGVRWYELRPSGSALTLFQQGTVAPDSAYRWMGSIAMDRSNDMAVGYSVSSSSLHPGIRYTGRLATDALGAMPQGEQTIITGAGSQSGQGLSRWGDYSEMTVDPVDDCTFWYVNQYQATTGAFNWSTRIGSFKFASCGGTTTNDFSMGANPSSATVTAGSSATSTISTVVTSGSAQTVALTANGLPTGASASFNLSSVTAGGSSTLTITTSSSTPTGPSTVTVTGTGTSATHTTTVTLTVASQVSNDFSINASPSSLSIAQGGSGSSTISTAVTSGSAQTVSLTATGLPSGASASFSPSTVTAGGNSILTITAGAATPVATSTVTITGTEAPATHATSVSLSVTASGGGPTVTNGGFEAGTLSGWTAGGVLAPVVVSSGAHSGTYAAQLGRNSAYNGDSTLMQTVTVPAGSSTLSFWYQPHCPDTITYDQQQAQLRSTSGAVLLNMLNVCSNSGTWIQVTQSLSAYANQQVVLWFNSHDDNYPADPTYTLIDDVSVTSSAPNPIANGGFESGLSGWTGTGTTLLHSGGHTGTYAAQVGSTSPSLDSTLAQTVTVPTGASSLTLWYQPHCPDTLTYDQEQVIITDNTVGGSSMALNVCSNSGSWTMLTTSMSAYAGHSITITLKNHDDNYATDPTYTYFDDVAIG